MMTADREKITLSVDAATRDRLEAAAALKGESVDDYCLDAIDRQLSDDDGGLRTRSKPLSHETLDRFDALRKELFGDKKFPGNSADVIREMREERALHLERVSKGR